MSINWFVYDYDNNGEEDELNRKLLNNANRKSKKKSSVIDFKLVWDIIAGFAYLIPILVSNLVSALFKKPKSIQGKICLITGAGRSLGRELSLKMASEGAIVICVDIRKDGNQETVEMIKAAGGKAYGYTCNIANYDEVMQLAKTIQTEIGRVYLLINNAGLIMVHENGVWKPDEVVSMFNVNVISHFWTIQAFLPAMKEINEGHIVSILSASALNGTPGYSLYGSTKAAGENLLCSLRTELNSLPNNKIQVTGIYPSVFNSHKDHNHYMAARIGFLQMETVVEKTVEAILYDKTCVAIPEILYYLFQFSKLLPEPVSRGIYDIAKMRVNVPSEEYKTNIEFNDILKKCIDTKANTTN